MSTASIPLVSRQYGLGPRPFLLSRSERTDLCHHRHALVSGRALLRTGLRTTAAFSSQANCSLQGQFATSRRHQLVKEDVLQTAVSEQTLPTSWVQPNWLAELVASLLRKLGLALVVFLLVLRAPRAALAKSSEGYAGGRNFGAASAARSDGGGWGSSGGHSSSFQGGSGSRSYSTSHSGGSSSSSSSSHSGGATRGAASTITSTVAASTAAGRSGGHVGGRTFGRAGDSSGGGSGGTATPRDVAAGGATHKASSAPGTQAYSNTATWRSTVVLMGGDEAGVGSYYASPDGRDGSSRTRDRSTGSTSSSRSRSNAKKGDLDGARWEALKYTAMTGLPLLYLLSLPVYQHAVASQSSLSAGDRSRRRQRQRRGARSTAPPSLRAFRLVRLQLALLSSARRELQEVFFELAEHADTTSRQGLHHLLNEAVVALLRRQQHFAYGNATWEATWDQSYAEGWLERASVRERSRFSEVTRSNFRGRRRRLLRQGLAEQQLAEAQGLAKASGPAAAGANMTRGLVASPGSPEDELVVVTLLVVIETDRPDDDGGANEHGEEEAARGGGGNGCAVQRALQRLAGVTETEVVATELLWTPEEPGDAFSREQLYEKYPLLMPL